MRYLQTDCTWFHHFSCSVWWCKKNFLDCILPTGFCVVPTINRAFGGCSNWWGNDAFDTSLEMWPFLASPVLLGMHMSHFWWKMLSLRVVALMFRMWHLWDACDGCFAELKLKFWQGGVEKHKKREIIGESSATRGKKRKKNCLDPQGSVQVRTLDVLIRSPSPYQLGYGAKRLGGVFRSQLRSHLHQKNDFFENFKFLQFWIEERCFDRVFTQMPRL